MNKYETLLSLTFRHEFFGSDNAPVTVSATAETNVLIDRYNSIMRNADAGFRILIDTSDGWAAILQEMAESPLDRVLEFQLRAQDQDFYLYTPALINSEIEREGVESENTVGPNSVLNFNISMGEGGFHSYVRCLKPVGSLEHPSVEEVRLLEIERESLRKYDTPVFQYQQHRSGTGDLSKRTDSWENYADAVNKPLCIIRIPLNELGNSLLENQGENQRGRKILDVVGQFKSRDVRWRYNLIFVNETYKNIDVVDTGNIIEFEKTPADNSDNTPSNQFLSVQTIPLSMQSNHKIELRGTREIEGREIEFSQKLPQASALNLKSVPGTGLVSDIYVN